MKLSKIDEYASQVPKEIRKAVKAFGNDIRCAIVVDLVQKGESTFTQLKDDLDIDSKLLSNHLKILMDGAILEHYYKHEFGNEQYSYYNLTLFGKDIFRGILEPLKSIQPSRRLPAISTGMPLLHIPQKKRTRHGMETFQRLRVQRGFKMQMRSHVDKVSGKKLIRI